MTAIQKTSLANAALVAFASSVIVPPLIMVVAVKVFGKQLLDLALVMFVFWALLLVAFVHGFFTRDTSKGRFVLVAAILLPLLMVALKVIAAMIGA